MCRGFRQQGFSLDYAGGEKGIMRTCDFRRDDLSRSLRDINRSSYRALSVSISVNKYRVCWAVAYSKNFRVVFYILGNEGARAAGGGGGTRPSSIPCGPKIINPLLELRRKIVPWITPPA